MTKKDSWIQLKHGFSINIPSDLHQIASFIFMEQESWMEVDVQFVETLAPYLSTSVDVGANYGFYSLLMANSGSKDIRIYSIEPNSNTSSHLRRSIRDGKFNVISVHEIAFSNFEGQATLTNSSNPELSELNLECDSDQPETKVCKLDNWLKKLGNFQVDFLKLDAEGSEMSILEGGKSFFDLQDPLIMFELKHGQKVQTELIDGFKDMGYEIFQYWPGVNCLVPVDTSDSTTFDPMRLNLYAVKISRQKILNDYGLLVQKFDNTSTTIPQVLFKTSFHEKLGLSSENLSKWYESSDSLSKKIFDQFNEALKERSKKGHYAEITFIGVNSAEIKEHKKVNDILNVTVDFVAEIITCIKDKEKKIISGDSEKIKKIYDTWVFSRDTRSISPNWQLVDTLT